MQGFYKNDNGLLLWSADRVINDNFELWIDQKDTYNYPVEGWIWADSEEEARERLQCYGIQLFPSWTINPDTKRYEPPVPYPEDDLFYSWDESSKSWIEQD